MSKDRSWISIPMPSDTIDRIEKAAARNDMSRSEYVRMGIRTYMERSGEWSLRGPKKGTG